MANPERVKRVREPARPDPPATAKPRPPARRAANSAVEDRLLELRRSEAFLDSVIENIPDMVFVKDARTLRFVRLNRAGEVLLGISRADYVGRTDYDFFPREDADFFTAKDREVIAHGHVVDIPEEALRKNGSGTNIP